MHDLSIHSLAYLLILRNTLNWIKKKIGLSSPWNPLYTRDKSPRWESPFKVQIKNIIKYACILQCVYSWLIKLQMVPEFKQLNRKPCVKRTSKTEKCWCHWYNRIQKRNENPLITPAACTHCRIQATRSVTVSASPLKQTHVLFCLCWVSMNLKKRRHLEISGEVSKNPVRDVLHFEWREELIWRTHFQAQETHILPWAPPPH